MISDWGLPMSDMHNSTTLPIPPMCESVTYSSIIKAAMEAKHTSVAKIAEHLGYTRQSSRRKTFRKRLENDQLSIDEIERIFAYLGVDFLQVHYSRYIAFDASAVEKPVAKSFALIVKNLGPSLLEQDCALNGNFQELRESIANFIANRICTDVEKHQSRLHQMQTDGIYSFG